VAPVLPGWVLPAVPGLPDWVSPALTAFPDPAAGLELDVVPTKPGCPQTPEPWEAVSGLAVAMAVGVAVEPIEPVLPEGAAAFPSQVLVMQGVGVTAGPEFPELPDVADPCELADPVLPELALPDEALVSFPLVEVAGPGLAPMVVPVAVELPLWPDGAVAAEPFVAFPVVPELAVPLALPDGDDPEP
jgi:hypothetical protein